MRIRNSQETLSKKYLIEGNTKEKSNKKPVFTNLGPNNYTLTL